MESTYRIVGVCRRSGRERVAASGLTKEQAEAKLAEMRRSPLMAGFSLCLESERQAAAWAAWNEQASIPHPVKG